MTTTLDHARTAPSDARVVIVGTERNPLVAALAVRAGIGEINSWRAGDAYEFPLSTLTRRAHLIVDLLGGTEPRVTHAAMVGPPIIVLSEPTTALLALPGLLAATATSRQPARDADCLAAALALVDATPAERLLPDLSNPVSQTPSQPRTRCPLTPPDDRDSQPVADGREEISDDHCHHSGPAPRTHQPPPTPRMGG